MSRSDSTDEVRTFLNPVYPRSFPDPFVLKHRGQYFAYCTGFAEAGGVFGIITSTDLVSWLEIGGAMEPLAESPPYYWAPEVSYDNGKFYLYYSCGNETLMHIRVAVSGRPDGGFIDCGRRLTGQEFAIDPHIFTDTDGTRYLFYATDFLDHSHIGTGTVVDKMNNWFELEGNPRPVARAAHDWQIYDAQRTEKGGVRWHTVEGPTVLKRKNKYFEMFSGGNWQNVSYGVSFATSDSVLSDSEWSQYSDGAKILPVLRTVPGVVGPGHNSVIRGPNNRELYCVYHRWIESERVMSIDRMDFAGDRIFVTGATKTPQIAPYGATQKEILSDESDVKNLRGEWSASSEGSVVSDIRGTAERIFSVSDSFLCEFTFKCHKWKGSEPSLGVRIHGDNGELLEYAVLPRDRKMIARSNGAQRTVQTNYLPMDFVLSADHLARIEVRELSLRIKIDDFVIDLQSELTFAPRSLSLFTSSLVGEFSGFSLTDGFEDLFERSGDTASPSPWTVFGGTNGELSLVSGELIFHSTSEYALSRGAFYETAEYAANLRFASKPSADALIGMQLLDEAGQRTARILFNGSEVWLTLNDDAEPAARIAVPELESTAYRQFRLIKLARQMIAMLDDVVIADVAVVLPAAQLSIFCSNAGASAEMVRITRL